MACGGVGAPAGSNSPGLTMRLRIFITLLLTCAGLRAAPAAEAETRECVVLLHGVALSGWAMEPLAWALEEAGYRTVNLSYPSRRLTIEALADDYLPAKLAEHGVADAPRVHFVAHSMGGLVVRRFLAGHRPANLGRVVLLGPPNHGSAAADAAADWAVLRWIVGVNLPRLGTGAESAAARIGPADFELGIIAGTSQLNPLFNSVLSGEHDGVVTVESARLEGMSDFLVVPHSHTVMLWREAVQEQVVAFLRTGRFRR